MLKKRILVLMFLLVLLPLVGCLTPSNQAPILTSSPITTATVGVEYTYDVNATDPDGDTLTYSLATPGGMTINSATGLIKWTPVTAQIGDNLVTVKVSDGSLSITQSFTIKVSTLPPVNQAPVINSTPNLTATVGVTYFYDVNATDPNNDTLNYFLTACPSGMVISSDNGLIWWTPIAEGAYAVAVKVSDGALSDNQGFTIVVSKPTVPPETYTITASAGPGGTISPLGDVTVNKGSDRLFTITPNALYSIEKVLVDGGSVGAVAFYTFTNVAKDHTIHATFSAVEAVNQAPTITSDPVNTAILGVEYIYDVEATDPDGDVLTYSILTTKPDNMTINPSTGVISWIPTAEGEYPIVVEVSDGVLSDTQSFTITVSTVEITGIEVVPDTMTLFVGEPRTITSVTAHYQIKSDFEVPIPFGDCIYDSNNPAVATVLTPGVVTGEATGVATITVTYAGKSDTIVVTVSIHPSPVHNVNQDTYYTTIQIAIDAADPGDTIEVAAGTYDEDPIIDRSLTLRSVTGDYRDSGVIIAGTITLSGINDNITIQGFNFSFDPLTMVQSIYSDVYLAGDDLVIQNNSFTATTATSDSNKTAIHIINPSAARTGWVFDDNLVTGYRGMHIWGSYTPTDIMDVTITNNVIDGDSVTPAYAGISVNAVGGIISGNVISYTADAGINIGSENTACDDLTISNNTVTHAGCGLWDNAGAINLHSDCTDITITGNTLSDSWDGVTITDKDALGSGIAVNSNNITGNSNFGIFNDDDSGTLDAENNWWGSEHGPKHDGFPALGGDTVSDNVDYEPFLTSPH